MSNATRHNRLLAAAACALCLAASVSAGQPAAQPGQPPVAVSPVEAFNLMLGEAEKGNPTAMLTLGTLYEQGIGTPRNFAKAFEWYKKAAVAGNAEAYYRVGVAYEIGLGNSGDVVKAFENFEKAAELNLPEGFYKLASMYIAGNGVQKNESWGVSLLNRAVGLGHMGAANDLGVVYYEGLYGQPKDIGKAFEMFNRAAEFGNAEAMKNIGVFFRDGIGRPADQAQELKWYTLAQRAGFASDALNAAIAKLREAIGPARTKQVEGEVDKWIAAFQARHAQLEQQRQAAAKK